MAQGLQPQTMTSAELSRYLSAQIARWTEVARKANLKPE
jgi:tripartite-type tricarboxylate transporter receptor subunit TctC